MTSTSEGATNLPYCYKWPRPAVTVDCLIYTLDQGEPWILLIKRKNDPCKGSWALPGELMSLLSSPMLPTVGVHYILPIYRPA